MRTSINTDLLKRLRSEKRWSQEELAIAAAISTRTVQRLEASGTGSTNSIRSIASALEIDLHNLEENPRVRSVGMQWGIGGVTIGTVGAILGIASGLVGGNLTGFESGLSMGIVGLISGTSCAVIGLTSAR